MNINAINDNSDEDKLEAESDRKPETVQMSVPVNTNVLIFHATLP